MSTALLFGGLFALLVALLVSAAGRRRDERPREVLPSHYSVERYVGATSPDVTWCRECGAFNRTDDEFCRHCTASL